MNVDSVIATPVACACAWSAPTEEAIAQIISARFFNGRDSDYARISRWELTELLKFAAAEAREEVG